MTPTLELDAIETPLRSKIKLYKKKAGEIEAYLSKKPDEWGKFQSKFNQEVSNIFREIMNFEKVNFSNGQEEKVYKLKRIFVNRFRELFSNGVYGPWSIRKPFGYAGDFKIIDDIYLNNPTTTGFDRLFDNYFQMSAISVAVRNRKEDFKRFIVNFINGKNGCKLKIMNLASGPCRDVKEILCSDAALCKNVTFDCYDADERAINYAKELVSFSSRVNFFKINAVKIALNKNINSMIDKKYDFIYATGLFDYFSERVCIGLVVNLKKILNPGGIMAIANVRDKYSNPSVHYMEWAGDWNLVYRDEEEFKNIFIEAGFKKNELKTEYEQQGIMQYIIASKKTD